MQHWSTGRSRQANYDGPRYDWGILMRAAQAYTLEGSPRMELPQAAQPQVDYGFTGKEEKRLESRSRWNLKSLRRKRKKDESVIEESDHHDKFIIREESLKNKFPDIISNDDTGQASIMMTIRWLTILAAMKSNS